MNVLVLAHSISRHGGGMERVNAHVVAALADEDVNLTVVAGEGLDELPDATRTHHVPMPRRPAFLRIVWFWVYTALFIRTRHFDVVISSGCITPGRVDLCVTHLVHASAPVARGAGPRWRWWNARLARAIGASFEQWQVRRGRTRRFIAVSDAVRRELANAYPLVPITVIRNGVDVAEFVSETPRSVHGSLRVVMVTGDFALKGVDLALEALRDLPNVVLTIVGDGPITAYERRAREHGVASRVTFTGYLDDVRPTYAANDVVLCLSRYESFGLFLVEAAASGCAVVSTNVGVAAELAGDGDGGVLVEGTAASVVAALRSLTSRRDDVAAMGATASRRAQRFDVRHTRASYREAVRSVATDLQVLIVGLEDPSVRRGGLNHYLAHYHQALRDRGVTTHATMVGPSSDTVTGVPAGWRARLVAVRSVVRNSPADLIDVHFAAHLAWALATGALRRRPFVVHFQGPWADESKSTGSTRRNVWVKRRIEQYVLRRADRVIVLSNAFRDVAIVRYGVAPARVRVIAPGVALTNNRDRAHSRELLGIDPSTLALVSVRRLVPRMGLHVGVDALAQLPDHAHLYVIGVGPERSALEERARAIGVAHRVTFTGEVDDATRDHFLAAADVSIVPSIDNEGYGLVVLESLAVGTPVVASNVGGLRDAGERFASVRLVPPGDALALADAIRAVADVRADADDVRREVKDCSWHHVIDQTRPLLESVIRRDAPPTSLLVLDHTARQGGGELALARLLASCPELHVLAVLNEDGPLVPVLRAAGVDVRVVELAPRTANRSRNGLLGGFVTSSWDTVRLVVRLRRTIRRLRPDVTMSNSLKSFVIGTMVVLGHRQPFVAYLRDFWNPPYLARSTSLLLRRALAARTDAVIANSMLTAAQLGTEALVLPSPVQEACFAVASPRRAASLRVAVIGRLAPWKGQHLLLDAVEHLDDVDLRVRFVGDALFGETAYARFLQQRVRDSRMDTVHFDGHVDDVSTVLNDVDVVVLSSLSPEPFGNVVTEAMAAGRVVIVPDEGGFLSFARDEENCLVYRMGDAADLARQLRRVAADDVDRVAMGEQARASVRAFSPEALSRTFVELIQALAA